MEKDKINISDPFGMGDTLKLKKQFEMAFDDIDGINTDRKGKKEKKERRGRYIDDGSVFKDKGTLRNKPCLCGSGKKFKKCCIDVPPQKIKIKKDVE